MDERDLLPVFLRYGASFNVYPQYTRIEDSVVLLGLLHRVYIEIIDVVLIT